MIKLIDSSGLSDYFSKENFVILFLSVDWAYQSTMSKEMVLKLSKDVNLSFLEIDVSSQDDIVIEGILGFDRIKNLSENPKEIIEAYLGGNGSLILFEKAKVKGIINRIFALSNNEFKERLVTMLEV